MFRSYDSVFKIMLVGGPEVGKTALIQRFIRDDFWDDYEPTMEVPSTGVPREIPVCDGEKTLQLSLFDTPGHSRFSDSITTICQSRTVDGVAVIFDVTNHESFQIAKQKLSQLAGKYLILVGNKCELVAEGDPGKVREVGVEEASSAACGANCPYIEVSAATGENVESAFERLGSDIRQRVHVKPGRH